MRQLNGIGFVFTESQRYACPGRSVICSFGRRGGGLIVSAYNMFLSKITPMN